MLCCYLLYQIGASDLTKPQIIQSSHYGISEISQTVQDSHNDNAEKSQIERTYKKMNEYLMEMELSTEDNLSDEEIMIMVSNTKLHTNRKKNKKENDIYGKESNYNLYC